MTLFHQYEGAPISDSGPFGTYAACDPMVIDDLKWLGLHHDNAHSLVYQSKRLAEILDVLSDSRLRWEAKWRAARRAWRSSL